VLGAASLCPPRGDRFFDLGIRGRGPGTPQALAQHRFSELEEIERDAQTLRRKIAFAARHPGHYTVARWGIHH